MASMVEKKEAENTVSSKEGASAASQIYFSQPTKNQKLYDQARRALINFQPDAQFKKQSDTPISSQEPHRLPHSSRRPFISSEFQARSLMEQYSMLQKQSTSTSNLDRHSQLFEPAYLAPKSSNQTPYADLKHKLVRKNRNSALRSVLDFKRKENPFLADPSQQSASQSPKHQEKPLTISESKIQEKLRILQTQLGSSSNHFSSGRFGPVKKPLMQSTLEPYFTLPSKNQKIVAKISPQTSAI